MKNWFSRNIVIYVDPDKIEFRSKKGRGTFTPHIELDPKGIVISVGKSHKANSQNGTLHIFTDTWKRLHALIMQSYFKHFVSQYGSRFLRPVILLLPSKNFLESYGKNQSEYLSLTLATLFGSEVFLCDENQTPYAFFRMSMGGKTPSLEVSSIPEEKTKRVRDRFKDILQG